MNNVSNYLQHLKSRKNESNTDSGLIKLELKIFDVLNFNFSMARPLETFSKIFAKSQHFCFYPPFPEASESVRNNFCMDDYLESSQTVEQATRKTQDLVKLLNLSIFTLTKFKTNVPSHSSQFQQDRKPPENDMKVLPTIADSSHVLGLGWNHRVDTLFLSRVPVQT